MYSTCKGSSAQAKISLLLIISKYVSVRLHRAKCKHQHAALHFFIINTVQHPTEDGELYAILSLESIILSEIAFLILNCSHSRGSIIINYSTNVDI